MDVVNFYSVSDDFGQFSNFAPFPIDLGGERWPTSEHYFQAQKFEDEAYRQKIRKTASPMQAARLGRDRKQKLRRDWEAVKVGVMRQAVAAKFMQHEPLRALLLSTGDAKIVEHTENDDYWGDGGDGSGKNMLGRILMQVRKSCGQRQTPNHPLQQTGAACRPRAVESSPAAPAAERGVRRRQWCNMAHTMGRVFVAAQFFGWILLSAA